jgi:tetratricopeptide (TPR) repeat protein
MADEELTEFEKLIKTGIDFLNSDRLTESEEKLAEALKIASDADQRFQAVRALLNLSGKYLKLGYEQPRTLQYYLQAVDVDERTRVMELLASLYKQMEDYAGAERIYVEIYDIRVQSLGPNHPDTMGVLQTAAMLVQMQGKSPEGLYAKAYNATRQAAVEERERSPHNHTEEIPIVRAGSRTLTDMQAISDLLTATAKLPKMDRPKPTEKDKGRAGEEKKESETADLKDSAMADSEPIAAQLYLDEQLEASDKVANKAVDTQELPVQDNFAPRTDTQTNESSATAATQLDAAKQLLGLAAELAESAIALSEHAALLASKGLKLAQSHDALAENRGTLQEEAEKAMQCITSARDKYDSTQAKLSEIESALSAIQNESTASQDASENSGASAPASAQGASPAFGAELNVTPSGQPFPHGLRLAAVPQRITIADIQAAAAAAAVAQSDPEALLEARANISPEALAKIKTTSSSPLSMIDDMMQGSSAVEQERSLSLAPDVQPEIVTKNLLLEPGWQQIIIQWEQFFTSLKIRIAAIFQQQMPVPYNDVLKKNQELFEKAYPIIKQIDFRFVFEEHDQLEDEIRTDVDIANAFKRIYSAWDGNAAYTPHEIGATYAWLRRCVTLGAFHQDTLRSLFRLGIIMTEQTRMVPKTEADLGLKLMRFVRAASDNHPKFKVLDRIRNATILARKLLHDKQPEEALSLFNIAYRAAKTCDDVSPAEMTDLLKNLAKCHETMGNYQGATDLFERIRRVQEAMSRNSEDLCETTIHLLTNYRILNNEQAATACQQRILCELDWLEKPSAMKIFAATKCEEMAQMDLAEQLCKDVLAQSDGDESSASKALVLLARIYEKTGRAKEADRIKIVLSRTGK